MNISDIFQSFPMLTLAGGGCPYGIRLGLLVLLASTVVPEHGLAGTARQILPEGGFEHEVGEDSPWTWEGKHPPMRHSMDAYRGRWCLRSVLQNEGAQPSEGHARYLQREGIASGAVYDLSCWVKALKIGPSYVQQVSFSWLDEHAEEISKGLQFKPFRGGDQEWQEVRFEAMESPDGAVGFLLSFRFVTGAVAGGHGEVLVDDVSLNQHGMMQDPVPTGETTLFWRNGDAVSGRLLPSQGRRVRWASPVFSDVMQLDTTSLDTIHFARTSVGADGAFRVGTVTGDVLTADLLGADIESLRLKTQRHGVFSVQRKAVYSFTRIENPNKLFEGTQFADWDLALGGPVNHLVYRVYDTQPAWLEGPFPDLMSVTPRVEGRLASSYFDTGLAGLKDHYTLFFEGGLDVPESAEYAFHVSAGEERMRLWLDGELLVSAGNGKLRNQTANLEAGTHVLRVEYVHGPGIGDLRVWWTGPGFKNKSLVGTNRQWGWQQGVGGHPTTRLNRTGIFSKLVLPQSFHMDVELFSEGSPRFLMGLGRNEHRAEAEDALRLETWENELVLVGDSLFEPVMTLEEGQREFRIRMSFDHLSRTIKIHDLAGRQLVHLQNMDFKAGPSGIFLRNRGEDLTVRRISVYQGAQQRHPVSTDATRPGVHMVDGGMHYGHLILEDDMAEVLDQEGKRVEVDLKNVDRLTHPETRLQADMGEVTLAYADGGIIHGRLVSLRQEQVMLQTQFTEQPLFCSLEGATRLRFNASPSLSNPPSQYQDTLDLPEGGLRGRLAFGLMDGPLGWSPAGSEKPLRLSGLALARIERGPLGLTEDVSHDSEKYSAVIHLGNGEVIPCMLQSYDGTDLGFESPYIQARTIASMHFKAVELNVPRRSRSKRDKTSSGQVLDSVQLERALTVPRFSRNHPPSHIIVAINGDMLRGRLISIGAQGVRFESKLREHLIPMERVDLVVEVGNPAAFDGVPSLPSPKLPMEK